jgi:anti-sigma factor RsiW
MTCDDVERLSGAYLDGELDAARAAELEDHLSTCAACTARLAALGDLSTAIRSAPYHRAPETLVRWAVPSRTAPAGLRLGRVWPWAAAAVLVLAVGAATWLRPRPGADAALSDLVVASHVRSLMAAHLLDVASSDRHTVKPWFAGRIDFAPTVVDLAADGFPLAGGRLDYLDGRPVAALVYQRHGHTINVFVWPSAGQTPVTASDSRGFHLSHWTAGGMTYWAISDVARSDLDDFVTRLAAALAGGA